MTQRELRDVVSSQHCVLVPGVYDCLSALLAEREGFPAIAISGHFVEASLPGRPDFGFAGLSEVAGVACRTAAIGTDREREFTTRADDGR